MQEENPKIEEVFPVIYNILADFTISEIKELFTTLITTIEESVTLSDIVSDEFYINS